MGRFKRALMVGLLLEAVMLGCGGVPSAPVGDGGPDPDLATKGPAPVVREALAPICLDGHATDPLSGLSGLTDEIEAVALPKVLFTSWIDGGLGDADNGKVREVGSGDYSAWYAALDAYCAAATVCDELTCSIRGPDSSYVVAHRVVEGQGRIVGAFKAVTLTGDTASLEKAHASWLAAVVAKFPVEGGAVAEVPPPADAEPPADGGRRGGGGRPAAGGGGGGGGAAGGGGGARGGKAGKSR